MSDLVTTTAGKVRGSFEHGVYVYRGIPYAAPPFGPLRFLPPQPAVPWSGVRDALVFGPKPPQPVYPPTLAPLLPQELGGMGEDCLILNVWTPEPAPAQRPVMVWIAGGLYAYHGTGASPWYDGSAFAADGVVLVTINYRVAADGFLHLGKGNANRGLLESDSGTHLGTAEYRQLRRRPNERHGVRRVCRGPEYWHIAWHAGSSGVIPKGHPPKRCSSPHKLACDRDEGGRAIRGKPRVDGKPRRCRQRTNRAVIACSGGARRGLGYQPRP